MREKRRVEAIEELKMQADLFVKSHLLEEETTTIAPDSPTNQEYNNFDDT